MDTSTPNWFENEVLATISHELRIPLTTIKGFTTTLLRNDRKLTRTERLEYLREIDKACNHQEVLINRLLRIFHLVGEETNNARVAVALLPLAQEAIAAAESHTGHYAGRQPHRFQLLAAQRDLPDVAINPTHIREVLDQLIENAIKYSPNGGEITVILQPLDLTVGHTGNIISAQAVLIPGMPYMEVVVRDQGIGIPPALLGAVFQPFHRVDMRLTREIGGVGIGLAFCRKVVEINGGAIWAESTPTIPGSIFHLALPLAERNTSEREGRI